MLHLHFAAQLQMSACAQRRWKLSVWLFLDFLIIHAMDMLFHSVCEGIQKDGNSQNPSTETKTLSELPGTHFMSTFHSGTNSDSRHSLHSCSLPVNTSWVFKVAFDFCSNFLWQQPHASNDSSVHCLSGLLRLSCAALYANPHNKRLELRDTCEPHALWISFFHLFLALVDRFLTTVGLLVSHLTWSFFHCKTTGVPQMFAFHCADKWFLHWSIQMRHLLTINHTQHSPEVGPHVSHSMLAHSSKLSLYMLHHCDKYPAYL